VKLKNGTTSTSPARVYHGVEYLFETVLNLSGFTEITPSEHITGAFVLGEIVIQGNSKRS
jgi:hypothetical protein